MARLQISDWIREQLIVQTEDDPSREDITVKRCTAFALVHFQGNQQVELKAVRLGSRQYDPKELADMFETSADTFAAGVPGIQQFQILAFFDDKDKPQAYYPFRKNGESEAYGLTTEPPTNTGITTQLMRHNEALARISAGQSEGLFHKMIAIIERQDNRIHKMEKEQLDTVELAKNLIMQQAADMHTRTVEIIKLKQSQEDRKHIMQLAPAIINRVTGKEIFPQATADTAIFENLAESLTEDQIMKLSQILKPEQWGLIADRMVEHLKNKEEKKQDEKRLTEGTKDAAE